LNLSEENEVKIKTELKTTNRLRKIEGFFFLDLFNRDKIYVWHRVRSHIYKNLINVISSSIFNYKCVEILYKSICAQNRKKIVENIRNVVVEN